MNKFYFIKIFYFILSASLIVISACDYDAGPQVWNPKETYQADPTITSVDPDGSVFSDAMEIRIIGDNFLSDKEKNVVYFDTEKATVISASKTELVVVRPKIIGDAITVKVTVDGALKVAKFSPYKIYQIVSEYSTFGPTSQLLGLSVDLNEILFTFAQGGYLYNVNAEGSRTMIYQASFVQAKSLQLGPHGLLYFNNRSKGKAQLTTVSFAGGVFEEKLFCTIPKACDYFDFDQNGGIYSAWKNTGMYYTDPELVSKEVSAFVDYDVRAIRVFDGYVYVSAAYTGKSTTTAKKGIYRAQITNSATGELGSVETYFDWNNSGEFTAVDPGALTFTEDGDALIGTENANPIFTIHPDGSAGPLYSGLLPPAVSWIYWGNGNYFYYIRTNDGAGKGSTIGQLIKVRMTKKGAPYYGRNIG
jgi:hypothetical protein